MFKKKTEPKFTPADRKLKYPKWSIVYSQDSQEHYLVLDKSKKRFISARAAQSWGRPILVGTEKTLSAYTRYGDVGFSPGSVLTSMDGVVYYITGKSPVDTEKLKVATPDFFDVLGFNKERFVVSDEELRYHKDGGAIENVSI